MECLGVELGKKLYAGHQEINAKGYFEHTDIADLTEEALLGVGSSWDDILLKSDGWWESETLLPYSRQIVGHIRRDFSDKRLWALKDPRICRLLPWWLQILAGEGIKPYFMFVIRSPEAVFRSLRQRDGFSREKSYLLWLLHYLDAERWSRGHPRAFVEFDRLVAVPVNELMRAEGELGLEFPVSPRRAESCLREFLSAELKHHSEELAAYCTGPILDLARDAHELLQKKALKKDEDVDFSEIDALRRRLDSLQSEFPQPLLEHVRDINERHAEARQFVSRTMRSWSWFVGKPIRFVERLFGRDV
jgi:hypothetical protein